MEEKKMDIQEPENGAQKLDGEQLESVSGGTTVKEGACIMSGKHKVAVNNASAFEIINTDGSHTIYYFEECRACGSKYYKKYYCSSQKKASISMQEYLLAKQHFGTQSF